MNNFAKMMIFLGVAAVLSIIAHFVGDALGKRFLRKHPKSTSWEEARRGTGVIPPIPVEHAEVWHTETPSTTGLSVKVIPARDAKEGDTMFASYHRPPNDELVCAWVTVEQIKYHTDTSITMLSRVDAETPLRWVEYPLDAPIILAVES